MNRQSSFLSLATATLLVLAGLAVGSCGESAQERAQREKIDSLENANAQGRMDYADLQQYLTVIAEGLDSISLEEGELLASNTPGEGRAVNRQRMKQNLDHVRELLSRHRDRISDLERQLANGQGDAKKLRTIITALRQQVEAKDRELEELRAQLDDSRADLALLADRVKQMGEVQQEQQDQIQQQQEQLQQQEQQIYNAYVKIGSKRQLKEAGLLSGGFLKKSKVDYSQVDLSQFQRVDMRTVESIPLPGKAKLLTPVPAGSYVIESAGKDSSVLRIVDKEKFWSVSHFIIIQAD